MSQFARVMGQPSHSRNVNGFIRWKLLKDVLQIIFQPTQTEVNLWNCFAVVYHMPSIWKWDKVNGSIFS